MPAAQAGVAAAVASTSRQVGATLGVAIVGAAAGGAAAGVLGPGFAQATHAGWWIITGCGLAVLAARPDQHHGLGQRQRPRGAGEAELGGP